MTDLQLSSKTQQQATHFIGVNNTHRFPSRIFLTFLSVSSETGRIAQLQQRCSDLNETESKWNI